jgi:hypothetical protein
MKYIAVNALSIVLVLLTGYMIYADKPYWGWVLFAALLCGHSFGNSDDKEK